jgi:hypothetical protein
VAVFGKRRSPEALSVESEHDRIRAIRIAAADELGRLRRELAERVASVEAKERELADAIASLGREGKELPADADSALAHARVGLASRAHELNRREAALDARERALVQEEAELARRAGTPDAERRLARIEARLAELQEAEKAFARTQAELAERSDELARREAALLERRRGHGKGAAYDSSLDRAALDEFDERLRRLERETREATDSTFDSGLRTLEQRGAGGTPPAA